MRNEAPRFARTFAQALGCLVLCVAALGASPASAADSITCVDNGNCSATCSGTVSVPSANAYAANCDSDCANDYDFNNFSLCSITDYGFNDCVVTDLATPSSGFTNIGLYDMYFGLLATTPFDWETSCAMCGNGIIDGSDECDDSNATAGDGCSALCAVEDGWACVGEPSECAEAVPPAVEGDVESTVHKVIVASAPFVCLAAFFAACWGWPLKRRK